MREKEIIATAIYLLAMIVVVVCILCVHASINRNEIMLNDLKQQKEELQIKNKELEKEIERETIYPEEIDCETEMREGDIRVRITIELYNPFGEWVEITEENAEYQITHGGRVINCK